jgi:DNA polymerase I
MKNAIKRILLIDGNHLIYRAFFKFKGLRTLDGKATSVVYGGPYILESIIRRLGPDKVMVVFDHGRSDFRKGILPDYKQRESKLGEDKDDFFRQRDELVKLLIAMGLTVFRVQGYEADDIIAYLSKVYYKMGWDNIIVSADKDFVQLINTTTLLYNVNKGVLIDELNCKEHYGYTVRQCVDYLSICGDESDHIPGYPGIGPATATKLFDKFGSVRKFLRSSEPMGKIDKEKLKLIHERNRKLIDLNYFLRHVLVPENIKPINSKANFNKSHVMDICMDNQINSFIKPQFINTFINLSHEK